MLEIGYSKNGQYGVVDEAENEADAEKKIAFLQKAFPSRNGIYMVIDTFDGKTFVVSAFN